MRRQPMAIAFTLAVAAAAILAFRPGFRASDLWPIVIGSTLTAAMTGIIVSVMQFVPQRLFAPFTVIAAAVVALLVSGLLAALQQIWLGPIALPTALVWPCAAVAGLVISRAAGLRFPRRLYRRG